MWVSVIIAISGLLFTVLAAQVLPVEELAVFISLWSIVSFASLTGGVIQVVLATTLHDLGQKKIERFPRKSLFFALHRLMRRVKLGTLLIIVAISMFLLWTVFFLHNIERFVLVSGLIAAIQLNVSIHLGKIQASITPETWGIFNLINAFIKILLLILLSRYTTDAYILCIAILILNASFISKYARRKSRVLSFLEISRLLKGNLSGILSIGTFWFIFHMDLMFSPLKYTEEGAAEYSLISNLIKGLFLLNLLDLWKISQKGRLMKVQDKNKALKRLMFREILKFIALAPLVGIFIRGVALELYKVEVSLKIVDFGFLLAANVFWSICYAFLLIFQLDNKVVMPQILITSFVILTYFVSLRLSTHALPISYLLSSVIYAIALNLLVRKSTL
jgi:hypothetical protein